MRIIGGKYRGKKLISPASEKVRPTSDKAREALFNILRNRLGADFRNYALIDVFAGSGALGLEAVSQGFGHVTLVDVNTRDLEKNVALLPMEKDKIKIIRADATKVLNDDAKYDVLFMDAPYHQGLSEKALVSVQKVLKPQALCLIEVERNEDFQLPINFELLDERRYGLAKMIIASFIS